MSCRTIKTSDLPKKRGRPINPNKIPKTKEEINAHAKEYNQTRYVNIRKIIYLVRNYNIPDELKNLPQHTPEEIKTKLLSMREYVNNLKNNLLIN